MSGKLIFNYVAENYKKMFCEPDGQLKHKYITPGATYYKSLWDWDCWLTNVALRQCTSEDISEYEKGCIINFLEHIDKSGRIPYQITADSFLPPDYHDENFDSNIHKPCLAQHTAFIVKSYGDDIDWLRPYFDDILKFVDYYMNNYRHETGLYYWVDDCGIGVDNDPCTFFRTPKSSGSIYLNCLMFKELEAVCYLGELLGNDVSVYRKEADNLKNAIRENCYDEKDGFYYSVDFNLLPKENEYNLHAGAPRHWDCIMLRIGVWSGFMAMWSGIATPEQADRMVKENLLDDNMFWCNAGVRSLSKYEKMYSVKATENPSCWLGPVWIVANYMVFKGLVKYGYNDIARELAEKTISLLEKDIISSGDIHEYYDPESGSPMHNIGFQNWNLLAVNMKAWLDGKEVIEEF